MEYIFVNDCTPDGSMSLLETVLNDYPHRREQVRVINHEHNMGLGTTRRDGMKAAKGDYVISCDSDDWVDTDAYGKMYAKAIEEDADLVCCGYYEEYANKRVARLPSPHISLPIPLFRVFASTNGIGGFLWNKLVRRKLYVEEEVYPYEGINMWEDVGVTVRLCYLSAKTVMLTEPFYHYNQQNVNAYTAVLRNRPEALVNEPILCVRQLEAFFHAHNVDDEHERQFCYVKFNAKHSLLLAGRFQEWLKLFPETHQYIWDYPATKFYRRVCYTLASKGIFIHYKLRNGVVRCLPSLVSRK
jgi:glycosyltransferase involved in cell wall biosynthesis